MSRAGIPQVRKSMPVGCVRAVQPLSFSFIFSSLCIKGLWLSVSGNTSREISGNDGFESRSHNMKVK